MDAAHFETLLSVAAGLGLSAACGFRVFVPLLVMSVAGMSGHLTLSGEFAWIASYPALVAFAVATVLEVAGNAVPAVGSTLNALATPAAMVAGSVATAACVTELSPFLKWTLAIIAGGGSAGVVQLASVALRMPAHAVLPGAADPGVSVGEAGGSLLLSVFSVVLPLLALVLALVTLILSVWFTRGLWRRWRRFRGAKA